MSLTLETVTANLAGKVRREKLHGRDYFVAPLSMIVPGVLNGSDGPIFYPPEEGAKSPDSWNIMPIVVNHPKDKDGKFVSARDPDVLNAYGIGYVFRSNHSDKLSAEGWFDAENTRRIEPRIHSALERNQSMELSTGLFIERQPAPSGATFNGMGYTHVARNYRPDHLAILPDSAGACSIKDGCGLNVNEDQRSLLTRIVDGILGTKSHQHPLELNEIADKLTENAKREMSFEERRNKIDTAFRAIYPYKYTSDGPSDSAYVVEVYDTYLICRQNGELYQHDYSIDKAGVVTIAKLATQVQRVTSYEPVKANATSTKTANSTTNEATQPLTANQAGATTMTLNEQAKKQILDNLITNCGCQGAKVFNESDREYLSKLPDDRLTALDESRKRVAANEVIIANAKKGVMVGNDTVTLNSAGEMVVTKKPDQPTFTDPQGRVYTYNEATQSYVIQTNAGQSNHQQQSPPNAGQQINTNRQLTEDEWKRMAPPRVQQMTSNYERWEADQKSVLVNQIQAHPNNVFSVDQLQAMEMQMLRNLANLAGGEAAINGYPNVYAGGNFGGAASPFTSNAGGGGGPSKFAANEDSDMAPPEIDWAKKSA